MCGNSAPCERSPHQRPSSNALRIIAVINTHLFDWILRQKGATNVNLFILHGCPVPNLNAKQEALLSHSALRLCCNHEGYAPLWLEQIGDEWREPIAKGKWPVLDADGKRSAVRAEIDAVVAEA